MDRKAIYSPTLVILVVFLLAYASFAFLSKDISITKVAGQNQIKLIDKYQEGEFIRSYVKQSARNSINNALYEFGQNGGLKESKCKKNDYFLWDKNCKPDKKNYLYYFDKDFKSYLKLNKRLPLLNIKYEIEDNKLIARSENSIFFNLNSNKIQSKKQRLIDYSIRETGYDHWIKEASQRFNVDENLIKAVIEVESDYNPQSCSKAEACGLMQLKKIAIKDLKEGASSKHCSGIVINDVFDPRQNINAGTCYLSYFMQKYGDTYSALVAYNIGPGALSNLKSQGLIPKEHKYVGKVNEELNKITGSVPLDTKKEAILTGTYEIDPSFIEKINFDFDVLDKLYDEVIKSQDCLKKGDITSDLISCIKDKKGFEWRINRESNFINFEIITNFKILKNENKRLTQDNLVIKFKTDLENR
tara:strand:- start:852 stop:2099 length:1248 start_codon:yes stop_codon:yes gene_type:complete